MPLSSRTKDPHSCDVCQQSQVCKRIGKCVKYKCKYGEGPEQKTITTPDKDPRACDECKDSARCSRLNLCLKHHCKFGKLEKP